MGAASYSVWIQARPEDVWRTYVDPSRIPDWQTGSPVIEDISGAGDEPGTTYISRRGPGAAQTTVLEAVRARHLVTRTQAYFGCSSTSLRSSRPKAKAHGLSCALGRSGLRDARCSASSSR